MGACSTSEMRTSLDLLDLPYTFEQLRLLTAETFASLARGRDVRVDRRRLEAVHRLGLLTPFFRAMRPTAEIRALVCQSGRDDRQSADLLKTHESTQTAKREGPK